MRYQRIPFIGGPLSGKDYWADTDEIFVKVQHSSQQFAKHPYGSPAPRYFTYHITEKNGHVFAVCGKECTCADCTNKQAALKEAS